MARFSIGEAVGEGFGLIKQRPFSVFVWGLLTILPTAASMGLVLPAMEDLTGAMVKTAVEGEAASAAMPDSVMTHMIQMQAIMAPLNALRFVLGVVVYTAIIRAVVRPRETSFFSLRLSMDEVRVFVVSLALIVGIIVGAILLSLLGVAVGAGLWQVVGAARGLVVALLVIGGIVGALLLGGRLSLLVPATVRFRDFAFVEGWNLGKGKSWALVGVMLLLVLIVIGIEIVVGGVVAGVTLGVVGSGGFDPALFGESGNPFEGMTELARANWAWLVAAVLIGGMLYGMLTAILTAPFASVVRQLSDETPAAH